MIAEVALFAVWSAVIAVLSIALTEQAADRRREIEYARQLSRRRRMLAERYGFSASSR